MCKTKTHAHVEAHGREWQWKLNQRLCEKKKVVESLSASLPCPSPQRDQPARVCAASPCPGEKLKNRRRAKFFGAALTLPPTLPSSPGKQKGGDGGERRRDRKGPEGRTGTSRAVKGGGSGFSYPKDGEGGLGWVSCKWKLKTGFFNPFLCIGGCWITWAI